MQKLLRSKSTSSWSGLSRRLRRFSGKAAFGSGLLLAGWLASPEAKAQSVANYAFAASSGTYTPLGGTATALPAAFMADEAVSTGIPLGFTFNFAGTDYTTVYASSNGFLSFNPGTGAESSNSPTSSSTTSRPLVAPLWDDMKGDAALGSTATYETTGAPGSRIFTFQWQNWFWRYLATAPNISFQVRLYEATGKVEFVYQQEAGALSSSPTASIALAGPATGSGNYLSLNNATASPTASSTTSTTNISTKPATGQVYAFSKPATDIMAVAFSSPAALGCFGANQTVSVTVKNTGSNMLDFTTNPLTVNGAVTGTNATTFPAAVINTGTLAPNATLDVVLSTTYNMTTVGTYTFNGTATVTGDGSTTNNTIPTATRTVTALATLPQRVNFTGFTGANLNTVFPGWTEGSGTPLPTGTSSAWTSDDFGNVVGSANGTAARINLDAASDNVWIISPKITATATTSLQYDLALTGFGNTNTATMGSDDVLRVMVSTDCGATYTPLRTYNASTPISNTGQNEVINLGAYDGQNIIVAFYASEGTVNDPEDNDLFIDEVFLGTIPAIDLGATALVNPQTTACFGPAENVTVTIKNFSNTPLDFSANSATVSVRVHGAVANLISTTVNTGTLAPGASRDVSVGTLNMQTAGTYNFRAYTTIATDGFAGNDTARTTRVVSPTVALPQRVDFTGYTGADLTTLFPNWKEATGATPTGTTSSWTSSTVLGLSGNTSAKINLLGSSKKEWIIGPKVTPTATTSLRFNAAITDAASANADAAGMQGTDDKVQIMVSNDCGITFNPIFTFDASNTTTLTNVLTDQVVSLAAYAGQNIIVAFFATEGSTDDTPSYDFHIDDVFIGTIPAIDLGATVFVTPLTTGCYTGTENVTVTIKNYAITPIDFSTTNATVSVRTHGAGSGVISTTLNTGILAPGATQNVSVGTVNMIPAGTYNFRAYTTVATDGFAGNDTARTSRTVIPSQALPQQVDFTGFDGSNLTTLFPNWKEAAGTTPAGTTSVWVSSTGLGAANNVTAKINLYTTTRNEWIMGPKVTPAANSALRFRAAITDYNNLNADPAGMQGTDDKVRVMVSTDCGVSFTPIFTFDASNTTTLTNVLTDQVISLSAYAGQNIILAFYGTDGPTDDSPDYDFHIDDIFIGTVTPVDLQATALVSPVSAPGCYGNAQNVIATIRNFGTGPLDFAANNATVTVTVTGAVTQTLTATLNSNALNNGNPLPAFGTLNVPVGTLNMLTSGAYTFNTSATVTGDGNTSNDAIAPVTITVAPVAAGTASAISGSVCIGNSTVLTLAGSTGGSIQWQQATAAAGPFSDIPNATTASFATTTPINVTTYYKAVVSCGPTTVSSNVITVTVNDPQVATTTPAARCGSGTVTLGATAAGAGTIKWYSAATGGAALATGTTYAPNVTTTTTFYAEANEGTGVYKAGLTSTGSYGSYGSPGGTGYGIGFSVSQPGTLVSTYVYPVSAGNVVVQLYTRAGAAVGSAVTVAVTTADVGNKTLIPLNIAIPSAGDYNLINTTGSVYLNRYNPYSGPAFPMNSAANVLSLTGGVTSSTSTPSATLYYSFFDFTYTSSCVSARQAVAATVNPVPVVNLGGATQNVCGATSTTLDAGNAGATYQWSLNGTAISGATSQTLVATTAGTYSVTVTNATNCTGTGSTQVSFNPTPDVPTISAATSTTFCAGGSVVLTGASTTAGVTYAWFLNGTAITGATSATYTANAAGNYTVVATTAAGCPATSLATTVTVNALPTPAITGLNATYCQNAAAVTLTGTPTGSTFTIDGVAATSFDPATLALGSHSVVISNTNASGCTATVTQTVTVTAAPAIPTITAGGPTTFCAGGSVVLTGASTTAGVTYAWYLNGMAISGATSATYTANASGNYTVVATAGGCDATSVATAVTVNTLAAVPTITAAGSTTICSGSSVVLTGSTTTTGVTYAWFLNGTAITGATSATYSANATGNYTVVATINGCDATSAATTVTVNPIPATPTITRLNMDLTSSSATGNQWYLNGSPIAGATGQTHTVVANGNYTVVVTTNGCASATSAVVNITNAGLTADLAGMSVVVYPNPNQGKFDVKLSGYNQKAILNLYSLTGQLIRSQEVNPTANEVVTPIHIENLAAGTYLLKVVSDKGVKVERLIVE